MRLGEDPRRPAKQLGIYLGNAAVRLAGHGMSGKKLSGGLLAEDAGGMSHNFALGAANIGEQRALGEQWAHALEAINDGAYGHREQNQLAAFNGFFRPKMA